MAACRDHLRIAVLSAPHRYKVADPRTRDHSAVMRDRNIDVRLKHVVADQADRRRAIKPDDDIFQQIMDIIGNKKAPQRPRALNDDPLWQMFVVLPKERQSVLILDISLDPIRVRPRTIAPPSRPLVENAFYMGRILPFRKRLQCLLRIHSDPLLR